MLFGGWPKYCVVMHLGHGWDLQMCRAAGSGLGSKLWRNRERHR